MGIAKTQERDWAIINARLLSCVTLLITLVYSTNLAQTSPPLTKPLPSPTLTPTPTAKPTPKPKPSVNKVPKLSDAELAEGKALLHKLGYWLHVDTPGLDASFRHAITAFQKVEGHARTGILTAEELQALRQAERPTAVDTTHSYIEIDLNRQVLFVVDARSEVQKILPVSTGSGELFTEGGRTRRAITPTGKYKVQRKSAGWRKSTL